VAVAHPLKPNNLFRFVQFLKGRESRRLLLENAIPSLSKVHEFYSRQSLTPFILVVPVANVAFIAYGDPGIGRGPLMLSWRRNVDPLAEEHVKKWGIRGRVPQTG
jgi:hypothetical protein